MLTGPALAAMAGVPLVVADPVKVRPSMASDPPETRTKAARQEKKKKKRQGRWGEYQSCHNGTKKRADEGGANG